MLRVNCNLSFEEFMEEAEPMLLKQETCNNLMLGLIYRFKAMKYDANPEVGHFGLVYDGGEAIYAFMQTPPKNWIFASMDGVPDTVIRKVAGQLKKDGYDVPGVIGPHEVIEVFVDQWVKETHALPRLHMKQLIYQLDKVNPVSEAAGYLKRATRHDEPIVAKWLLQFGQEVGEGTISERASEMAATYIEWGSAYLWTVGDTPVSMLNQSRRTANGVTVNAVYTPDEHKRKGYATSAVAALSQQLLDDGFQFCSLYTDMLNPTSNGIYRRIGYYEVGASVVYTF